MIPLWAHIALAAIVAAVIVYAATIAADRQQRLREEDEALADAAWVAQVDEWNQPNPPHRGPCRCDGCVISDDDDPATRWNKAMRGMGLGS